MAVSWNETPKSFNIQYLLFIVMNQPCFLGPNFKFWETPIYVLICIDIKGPKELMALRKDHLPPLDKWPCPTHYQRLIVNPWNLLNCNALTSAIVASTTIHCQPLSTLDWSTLINHGQPLLSSIMNHHQLLFTVADWRSKKQDIPGQVISLQKVHLMTWSIGWSCSMIAHRGLWWSVALDMVI